MLTVTYWSAKNPPLIDEVLERQYGNRTHLLVEHITYRAVHWKILALFNLSVEEEKKGFCSKRAQPPVRTTT
jgi:hypothetical protein